MLLGILLILGGAIVASQRIASLFNTDRSYPEALLLAGPINEVAPTKLGILPLFRFMDLLALNLLFGWVAFEGGRLLMRDANRRSRKKLVEMPDRTEQDLPWNEDFELYVEWDADCKDGCVWMIDESFLKRYWSGPGEITFINDHIKVAYTALLPITPYLVFWAGCVTLSLQFPTIPFSQLTINLSLALVGYYYHRLGFARTVDIDEDDVSAIKCEGPEVKIELRNRVANRIKQFQFYVPIRLRRPFFRALSEFTEKVIPTAYRTAAESLEAGGFGPKRMQVEGFNPFA